MMKKNNSIDWNFIPQSEINKPELSHDRGVKIQFMMSPFDVPSAFRAKLDRTREFLIVEFRYLSGSDSEPKKDIADQDGVHFTIGKRSKRIYRIAVKLQSISENVDADNGYKINESLLKRASAYVKRYMRNDNYSTGNTAAMEKCLDWSLKHGGLEVGVA